MAVRTMGRKKVTITLSTTVPAPIIDITGIHKEDRLITDFEIYFPTSNVGLYGYVGNSTVDNTWIPRVKTLPYNFVSGTGSMGGQNVELAFNASNWYVLGSQNGDVAIVEYMVYERT